MKNFVKWATFWIVVNIVTLTVLCGIVSLAGYQPEYVEFATVCTVIFGMFTAYAHKDTDFTEFWRV